MTYAEQLMIIQTIPLKEGDRRIMTCPFCGGAKKLSVKKVDGSTMWNCFRASCNGKGIHSGKRNLAQAKAYLNKVAKTTPDLKPLPSITTLVENHKPALDYLKSVNSLEAYKDNRIQIRYSPSDERVVFYGTDGAVGRSLRSYGPKWVTYGEVSKGIHIGEGQDAVLVEDTPSACAVSNVPNLVGVSMCGTTFRKELNTTLKKYRNVYLVLDKDAALKSTNIVRNINSSLLIRVAIRDLKYLTVSHIKEILWL